MDESKRYDEIDNLIYEKKNAMTPLQFLGTYTWFSEKKVLHFILPKDI